MISKEAKVMLVSRSRDFVQNLTHLLESENVALIAPTMNSSISERLPADSDLVIVDGNILNDSGVLADLRENENVPLIIMTNEAITTFSPDAFMKNETWILGSNPEKRRLRETVQKALAQNTTLTLDSNRITEVSDRFHNIIGKSKAMLNIYALIDSVSATTANVIVTGESGTGKELVAKAIHERSNRKEGPFVAVNCSAFPREILENELFGHEQGAFTGALKEKPGCFEIADGGTLFLDEVCEMPLETQVKMLRALEERCFRRLGGKTEIEVDVRVISATNQNIEEAVQKKRLREDIYYRLCVVEIELPVLRDRDGDIPLLMREFLKMFNKQNNKDIRGFSEQAIEVLSRNPWPGNVRELKNTIERAVVLCHSGMIGVDDLPKRMAFHEDDNFDVFIPIGSTLANVERELIFNTLRFTKNNKTRAAGILGISLKTLHNKLNQYRSRSLYSQPV